MALLRDIPFTVKALTDTLVATCSQLVTTGSTGVVTPIADSTADAIITAAGESTAFGRVIDRTRFPIGANYSYAVAGAVLHSSRGSTEADRKITIGVRVQHGDSSGGGDMADLSTGSDAETRQYFSTARSSDHASWDGSESTGELYAASNPAVYDLRAAKRYLRVAVPVLKNKVTTESSGDEQARLSATLTFLEGDKIPQRADSTGPYSTTTST